MKSSANIKSLFILFISLPVFGLVNAATITWNGSSNNQWNQVENWTPMIVPGSNDDVIIPASFTNEIIIIGANASCASLNYNGSGFKLLIDIGWELILAGDLNVSGVSEIYGLGGMEIMGNNDCHFNHSDFTTINISHINIKSNAVVVLNNHLIMPLGVMNIYSGDFISNGKDMEINTIEVVNNDLHRSLDIQNSVITLAILSLSIETNAHFNASNSTINSSLLIYSDSDAQFNIVNCTSKSSIVSDHNGTDLIINELNAQGDINLLGSTNYQMQTFAIGVFNLLHSPAVVRMTPEPYVASYSLYTVHSPVGCSGQILFTDGMEVDYNQIIINVYSFAHFSKAAFASVNVQTGTILVDEGIALGNCNNITFLQDTPINYFWINGSGSWSDGNHWSFTSGGAPSGCIPGSKDHAIFNIQSNFSLGDTIRIAEHAFCNNLIADAGIVSKPVMCTEAGPFYTVNVTGSIDLRGLSSFNVNYPLYLWNKTTANIHMGNNHLNDDMYMMNHGNWNLQSKLNCKNGDKSIYQLLGTFNTHGFEIFSADFVSKGMKILGSPRELLLGNSTVHMGNAAMAIGTAYFFSNNLNVNAGTSVFQFEYLKITASQFKIDGTEDIHFHNITYMNKISNPQLVFNNKSSFNKITFLGNGQLLNGSLNMSSQMATTDTLVITGNFKYELEEGKIVNIRKKVVQLHGICAELSIVSSSSLANQAYLYSDGAQALDFENVWMENIIATGNNVPFTVTNGIDGGNNYQFFFNAINQPRVFYWNGEGNTSHWSDAANWNIGFVPHAGNSNDAYLYNVNQCIPGYNDSVVFHSLSFPVIDTVSINENANFNGMAWLPGNVSNKILAGSPQNSMNNYGGLLFDYLTKVNFMGDLNFKSPYHRSLIFNQVIYPGSIRFYNLGKYSLLDSLNCSGTLIEFRAGSFSTNGNTIRGLRMRIQHDYAPAFHNNIIDFSNSSIFLQLDFYNFLFENTTTLYASNSKIYLGGPLSEFLIYGDKTVIDFGKVDFTAPDGNTSLNSNYYYGTGTPHFTHVNFNPSGFIVGNNSMDTLILAEGKQYQLGSGQTQVINNLLYSKGSPCYRTTITSTILGIRAYVKNPSCHLLVEHARLRDIEGIMGGCGANNYLVGVGAEDLGNNLNWFFIPGNPINGLGIDTTISCNTIPYQQTSLNFGRYESITWSTGSTDSFIMIDSAINMSATVVYSPVCIVKDDRKILFENKIKQFAGITNISCYGSNNGSIELHIEDVDTNYNQYWIYPNAATVNNDTLIQQLAAGFYTSIVSIPGYEKMCSDTAQFYITEPALLYLTIDTVIPGKCSAPEGIIRTSTAGGTGAYAYQWNDGSNMEDNDAAMGGNNQVIVIDESGCKDTLNVELTCIDHINIPELITPNGDGYSDEWEIIDLYRLYPNNHVKIYNRWGGMVYSKKGYNNQFTGIPNSGDTFNVGYLPSATYFYIIELGESGKTLTGYVELIY